MDDIRLISFPTPLNSAAAINGAIAELISKFTAAVDANTKTVFNTVKEGNTTEADIMPKDGEGVCLRIQRLKTEQVINTTPNFVFRKKVTLCIIPFFELQVSASNVTIDGFGNVEPVDYYRENLRRFSQKVLEDPTLTGNLTSLSPGQTMWWNFGHQDEEIEAEANYGMQFEKTKGLQPPWYSCPFYKILYVDVR